MFPINSLSGALAQSAQIQIQQSAEKSKQARKAQEQARNVAAGDTEDVDETEHPVENSEELSAIHDETPSSQKKRKQQHHKHEEEQFEEAPGDGLDLQA